MLVQKVSSLKLALDFKLISLIVCQYKDLGKLLANHPSFVIEGCVSFKQSTFLKGMNIFGGPLVLNVVMEWYRKRNQSLLVFKVDFEKALILYGGNF